jgi:peptidyl-tRNA hydrolase, PTH1 family
MIAVIGLGNPGPEYQWTRHNAGFLILDRLAARHDLRFRSVGLYEATKLGNLILVKPTTYMNRSGEALKSLRSKQTIEAMLAVSDDFHLPLGRIRLRERGGDGGHNGLSSLIESWGTKDFPRLRIGVGEPDPGKDPADFVLGRFRSEERPIMEETFLRAADLLQEFYTGGLSALQNAVSRIESYSGRELPGS